jgi:uncharacterized protein YcbK (DUF882 family)
MRRIPIIVILLAVFFAATVGASTAHATRTHKRASSAASRISHKNKRQPAAHAAKHARTRRERAVSHERPAVFRRRSRARQSIENQAAESEASGQPPSIEDASLSKTRVAMLPPLRGSFESLARQNQKTEADSLERIEDDDDLNDRIARGMLVPLPVSSTLAVNGKLPENRRYCRPWTATFLDDLAHAHASAFQRPLVVSSAVRTVAYQKRLMEVNGNAAQAEGDIASPHLTGAAIDIAKQGMNREEIAWMRARLLALQEAGKIDVEEEFHQSCFHITVYKDYLPPDPAQPAGQNRAVQSNKSQLKATQTQAGEDQPALPAAPAEIASQGR